MAPLMQTAQGVLQTLLDTIFPPRCAACQHRGAELCASSLAQVRTIQPPYCQHCHTPLQPGYGTCRNCQYHRLRLHGLRVAGRYEGTLRTCIHAFKYKGYRRLADPLGLLLVDAYKKFQLQADIIIPVPLHAERIRERGYNQAQLLAQVCATHLHLPLETTLLKRIRATPAQALLKQKERQQNVAGAFACTLSGDTQPLRGSRVLLIDDVCTTGATLEASAAPLLAAGAQVVWGLVLARPLGMDA